MYKHVFPVFEQRTKSSKIYLLNVEDTHVKDAQKPPRFYRNMTIVYHTIKCCTVSFGQLQSILSYAPHSSFTHTLTHKPHSSMRAYNCVFKTEWCRVAKVELNTWVKWLILIHDTFSYIIFRCI